MTHATNQSERPTNGLARLVAPVADPVRILSLLEQGLISGTNFLALLVLARSFQAEDFGVYSFAYISLQFLVNLHRSIVVLPFVIHTAEAGTLAVEGRLWQRLNGAVALIAMVGLGLGAAVAVPFGAPPWMRLAFLIAVGFVGPNFYYEFLRRWAIQLARYDLVVSGAAVYALISFCGFLAAVQLHSLGLAVVAYVGANLGAAVVFLPAVVRSLGPRVPQPMAEFLHGLKSFLTWSLLSNLAYNGYWHLPPLILGAMTGPVPVAAYQALRNFIQPLNIVGTAVDNFDKPRAARALAREGIPGLRRQLRRTATAIAGTAFPYVVLVVVFAKQALAAAYADRYGAYQDILYYWIASYCLAVGAYPFETGLLLLKRPDLLFRGRVLAAAIGISVCVAAVPSLGVAGAMWGVISGGLSAVLVGMFYLRKAAPDRSTT